MYNIKVECKQKVNFKSLDEKKHNHSNIHNNSGIRQFEFKS